MATRQQYQRLAEERGLKGPVKTAWVRAQLANDTLTSAREVDRQKKELKREAERVKREQQARKRASKATKPVRRRSR